MALTVDDLLHGRNLPAEFQEAQFLSNGHAATLLRLKFESSRSNGTAIASGVEGALKYADTFSGALIGLSIEAIDRLARDLREIAFGEEGDKRLHEIEISLLLNLNPTRNDDNSEAKALIPSLSRFGDDELSIILKIIRDATSMALQ